MYITQWQAKAKSVRVPRLRSGHGGMDQIKKAKIAGMSEDDQKLWESEVQNMTDSQIKAVDLALEVKQSEIMEV